MCAGVRTAEHSRPVTSGKSRQMVSDCEEVKDWPASTLARPQLSSARRQSGECFFSRLMDVGHSFVGLAIAVQMLVGVHYDAEDVPSSLCRYNKHAA